jgi:hypothetical protein
MRLDLLTSARCRSAPHANLTLLTGLLGYNGLAFSRRRIAKSDVANNDITKTTRSPSRKRSCHTHAHRDRASKAAIRWISSPKTQELWGNLRKRPTNRLTYRRTVAARVPQASSGWGLPPRPMIPIHRCVRRATDVAGQKAKAPGMMPGAGLELGRWPPGMGQ